MITLAWICLIAAVLGSLERWLHIAINIASTVLRGDKPESFGFPSSGKPVNSRMGTRALASAVSLPNPDEASAVLVQLPIFNEGRQARGVIRAACRLDWPGHRLMIQVLDDSTNVTSREIVDAAVDYWRNRGCNIEVQRRDHRKGYKAGALKAGMELPHVKDRFPFIAIFDADFRPSPDFLKSTIPYFERPDVGFVQARWAFKNAGESLLTRMQEIALNYHTVCEQYSRFATNLFFNFNGTAGVWRTSAIVEAGGWSGETVTEDMDLSLRAHLAGWKSVFVRYLRCQSELPTDYASYRNQQFRWACGPMQVWRRVNIWRQGTVGTRWKPAGLLSRLWIVFFFTISYLVSNLVTAILTVLLIPLVPFCSDLWLPITLSAIVWSPAIIGMCLHTPTWRIDRYVGFVLFQNVMSILKVKAVVSGLFDTKRAASWDVTAKKGRAVETPDSSSLKRRKHFVAELLIGTCYLVACVLVFFVPNDSVWFYVGFASYLLLQGAMFVAHGLNFLHPREMHLNIPNDDKNAMEERHPAPVYQNEPFVGTVCRKSEYVRASSNEFGSNVLNSCED